MTDEDDDIKLGRKLFRALQEDNLDKNKSSFASKVAIYAFVFILLLSAISCMLIMAGGPK